MTTIVSSSMSVKPPRRAGLPAVRAVEVGL
jgi:hypothetical protein